MAKKKVKKPLSKKVVKKEAGKKKKTVRKKSAVTRKTDNNLNSDLVLSVIDPKAPTKEELQVTIEKLSFQLEQANTQLDQFSHTTSHELQEPLRKIITFSKVLRQTEKKLSEEEFEIFLAKLENSALRLRKLMAEMLNFARVSNYEKLVVKTDLNEILKNTLFDLELLIEEKNAKFILNKLPEVEAVPFQMSQLFYDIIHNSLKFSNPDIPLEIEISTRKIKKKDLLSYPNLKQELQYCEICFKDNGIGFDQKYGEQIFTMFQRLSSAGEYPGTGIGLAICRKVVQTYFGEIYAEGKEGEGATIHVILPLEQPKKLPDDIPTILKTWL